MRTRPSRQPGPPPTVQMPTATTAHRKAPYKPQKAGHRDTQEPGRGSIHPDGSDSAGKAPNRPRAARRPATDLSPTSRPARGQGSPLSTHTPEPLTSGPPAQLAAGHRGRPSPVERPPRHRVPQPKARQNRARLICAHLTGNALTRPPRRAPMKHRASTLSAAAANAPLAELPGGTP